MALRAYQRRLVMHQLHYLDQIKPMHERKEILANASSKIKIGDQEIVLGKRLVENLTSKDLDLSEYTDAYAKQLDEMISANAQGKTVIAKEPEAEAASTKDLLEARKASVRKSKPRKG